MLVVPPPEPRVKEPVVNASGLPAISLKLLGSFAVGLSVHVTVPLEGKPETIMHINWVSPAHSYNIWAELKLALHWTACVELIGSLKLKVIVEITPFVGGTELIKLGGVVSVVPPPAPAVLMLKSVVV